MRLTVLGSAGSYPMPGTAASGFVVEHGGTRIWCDIGPGTFVAFPFPLVTLDAVVVSHRHADHCADLLALFHALAYPAVPRTGLPVYAPRSVFDAVTSFVAPGQVALLEDTLAFTAVADGSFVQIGAIALSFRVAHHSVPAVAVRFSADGSVLVYTGDTGPDGGWPALVQGADMLLSESTLTGSREQVSSPYHLTAAEAGSIAREAGVGRLLLTHIPRHHDVGQACDEAAATFGRPVEHARPGVTYDVGVSLPGSSTPRVGGA
jgi:ribonuclease BN (tRNA processing enzyme)